MDKCVDCKYAVRREYPVTKWDYSNMYVCVAFVKIERQKAMDVPYGEALGGMMMHAPYLNLERREKSGRIKLLRVCSWRSYFVVCIYGCS